MAEITEYEKGRIAGMKEALAIVEDCGERFHAEVVLSQHIDDCVKDLRGAADEVDGVPV